MSLRHAEIVFLLGILIGVFVFWGSANALPTSPRYAGVDADMWPRIVLVGLGLTTSLLLAQKVAAAATGHRHGETGNAGPEGRGYFLRLAIIAALILLYYFALQNVGFLLSTLAFVWAASSILPYANRLVKLAFAPLFTLALGLIFARVLALPLPRGTGVFYDISTWLF